MNIHHLELFYYVARHGGIMEAVRNMPYGIQQPAVSGQIAQLEEDLGVTLFQRRPFALTPSGEKLYQFISPFFANLDRVGSELRGGADRYFRIGASPIILRDHLPELFQRIRKRFGGLRIKLREGYQGELETYLQQDELDVAVTVLERKLGAGIQAMRLIELPLILLVDQNSPLKSAEELWRRDRIEEPLICLPASEAMSKHFQQGLQELGVTWHPAVEVSSTELIATYVAGGFGIGLSVRMPATDSPAGVRALPLPGFAPVVVGALWRGRPSALAQAFLDEMKLRASRLV
jgi:DNA-binding transcriptional LysR family regulator